MVTKDDHRLFIRAQREAIRRCLARFGVEASEQGPIDEASLGGAAAERPIGITDARTVARWGYHRDPASVEPGTRKGDDRGYDPTTRELELRQGVDAAGHSVEATDSSGNALPEGGCDAESWRLVAGGPDWDMLRGESLFSQAAERAEADPRLAAAWRAWSRCMAEAGYEYDTPWEANDDPRWWSAPKPSREELATATQDMVCRDSTELQATWMALLNARQRDVIDQEGASLAEWATRLERNRAAAKELLRDKG